MGKASNRLARRRAAQARLDALMRDPHRLNVIHYSCESFFGDPQDQSRRITSVAVLNIGSGVEQAFSVHQIAEELAAKPRRKANAEPVDPKTDYERIEGALLTRFYEFVERHQGHNWLHWNMRSNAYGFLALEHRCRMTDCEPHTIPETQQFNLAEALPDIFGQNYMPHRRLENTMRFNDITDRDFLSGEDEAAAFANGDYVSLHRSSLRKVQMIYSIAKRTWDGTLKVHGSWWDRHGSTVGGVLDDLSQGVVWRAITLTFAVIGAIWTIVEIVAATT